MQHLGFILPESFIQELILVISRCVSKKKKLKNDDYFYQFHFKGYYLGKKIRIIHLHLLESERHLDFLTKGEDYLLWVKRRAVDQEILTVELIKHKKIT